MKNLVIAGTDTNIGKTICSALLMSVLEGTYFKPVQSGSLYDNDTETVKKISELSEEHFLSEKYVLKEPLSPHRAAELENITIEEKELTLPHEVKYNPLIIELAGGLMVPINRKTLMVDVIKHWDAQIILCAANSLGTINHTLLSIEALKTRNIDLAGIIFIGEDNIDNQETIIRFSGIRKLGYIPKLEINKENLKKVFYDNFDVKFFKDNYGIQ
ncbi:MAG: dethiobiotin synthase [Candidatus Gastranaerophilales bacterium]|nr:dethiobiotin synthase [Candidatus Gastranaerophilales bacterium]